MIQRARCAVVFSMFLLFTSLPTAVFACGGESEVVVTFWDKVDSVVNSSFWFFGGALAVVGYMSVVRKHTNDELHSDS